MKNPKDFARLVSERGEARARQKAEQYVAAQRYYARVGAPKLIGRVV